MRPLLHLQRCWGQRTEFPPHTKGACKTAASWKPHFDNNFLRCFEVVWWKREMMFLPCWSRGFSFGGQHDLGTPGSPVCVSSVHWTDTRYHMTRSAVYIKKLQEFQVYELSVRRIDKHYKPFTVWEDENQKSAVRSDSSTQMTNTLESTSILSILTNKTGIIHVGNSLNNREEVSSLRNSTRKSK